MLEPDTALHAWVDESARVANAQPPAYLLGVVIANPGVCEDYRAALRGLDNTHRPLP